jgi:hypothetical protein
MRRRLAALGLLPVLVLGSATSASAAGKTPSEPGFTIKKVEHVVKYGVISWDPEPGDLLDGGMVRLDYTCRPGGAWGDTATVFLYVRMETSTVRWGEDVPCDGARHKVELPVGRLTPRRTTRASSSARGSRRSRSSPASSARPPRWWSTGRCPEKVQYRGDWPDLPWSS